MNQASEEAHSEHPDTISEQGHEINESLEQIISSFDNTEISLDALQEISEILAKRISKIKSEELPPVETDMDDINDYIEEKRFDLEKARESSVFVNDLSDEVEFHYSDHKAKFIEDEIKSLLNKRYGLEKTKFRILEELEELEARYAVCTKLLESYELRNNIEELKNSSEDILNNLEFNIEDFGSVTEADNDSIDTWDHSWQGIINTIGYISLYLKALSSLIEYFEEIKQQLEEKDPETKFVFDELQKYPEFEPQLNSINSELEDNLFTSMAALYELAANYEIGADYLPENKPYAVGIINKIKSTLINLRSCLDSFKLEYKEFRKTINNIFVLLNRAVQTIENHQKLLKQQQELRIKKIKEIVSVISKSSLDSLKSSTNEINNMINNLINLGASDYEVEALQFYFSLKARYPVEDSAREDIVEGLNGELENFNIMEIDLLCKVLEIRYEPKKGFFIDGSMSLKAITHNTSKPQRINQENRAETVSNQAQAKSSGKTGNLDFLGNMYLKEAQRSKGQWAAKSYLKAIEAFMKCASVEDDKAKKLSFLKMALKAAKDAVVEKEDASTLYAYAQAYRELANNHSGKIGSNGLVKIGDNFVAAAKYFIREENIQAAKSSFKEAYDAFIKLPQDDTLKSKIASIQKFI